MLKVELTSMSGVHSKLKAGVNVKDRTAFLAIIKIHLLEVDENYISPRVHLLNYKLPLSPFVDSHILIRNKMLKVVVINYIKSLT